MHDKIPQYGGLSELRDLLKFWDVSANISETYKIDK